MAKITLATLTSGYVSITQLNTNFTALATAIENTLSRDGTSPNTMGAQLDMNSNKITNLAAPSASNDAARLVDLDDVVVGDIAIPSQTGNSGKMIGTDGSTLSFRDADNLNYNAQGNIAATNVGDAIDELDSEKAKIGANSDITSIAGLTTPLTVAQGGTGLATLGANLLYVGDGTNTPNTIAVGTSGQVLTSNGASSDPTFQTLITTGTWTPIVEDGSHTGDAKGQTYSDRSGTYIKIGTHVFITGRIFLSDLGTLSGLAYIAGLPFDHTGSADSINVGYAANLAITAGQVVSGMLAGASYINLNLWDATGGHTTMGITELSGDGILQFQGHYITT